MILRPLIIAGLAACALAFSAAAALAVPYQTTQEAQVVDGDHRPIGTVPAGTVVEAATCSNGYCLVNTNGMRGWISQASLTPVMVTPNPPVQPLPQPQPQPIPDPNRPGFSFDFGFGDPRGPGRPINPPPRFDDDAQACFYDRSNFRGQSFCVYEGDSARTLPRSWNDNIASIRVDRGLVVTVCRDANFRGGCAEIDDDVRRLPSSLSGRISSFSVDFD